MPLESSAASTTPPTTANSNSLELPSDANASSPTVVALDPPSPTPTTLSFKPGDDQDSNALQQDVASPKPKRSTSTIEFITRDVDRDTPASPGLRKKSSKSALARKWSMKGSNYYAEVFSVREEPAIPKVAGVCVELKTNVILENEFDFAKSLSQMIAKRYNQSEESVCVTLDHSACMIMGGTFDGTYVLTITSVALISPTVNKRNAALITDWFKKNLGVAGNRGHIVFVAPEFSNYAIGGVTMLDQMEKEEVSRTGMTERSGLIREQSMKRSASRHHSRKGRKGGRPATADGTKPANKYNTKDGHSLDQGRMRKRSFFDLFTKSQWAREPASP